MAFVGLQTKQYMCQVTAHTLLMASICLSLLCGDVLSVA